MWVHVACTIIPANSQKHQQNGKPSRIRNSVQHRKLLSPHVHVWAYTKYQCPKDENYVKYSLATKLFTVITRYNTNLTECARARSLFCLFGCLPCLCFRLHILWFWSTFRYVFWFMENLIMHCWMFCVHHRRCTLQNIIIVTMVRKGHHLKCFYRMKWGKWNSKYKQHTKIAFHIIFWGGNKITSKQS